MNTNHFHLPPSLSALLLTALLLGGCSDDLLGDDVFVSCGDEDIDGVCDEDDICVGGDDTVDSDEDGTPDDCEIIACDPLNDAWACDGPLNNECVRMVFGDRVAWVCEPQCENYVRMTYGACVQWYCDGEPFGECFLP